MSTFFLSFFVFFIATSCYIQRFSATYNCCNIYGRVVGPNISHEEVFSYVPYVRIYRDVFCAEVQTGNTTPFHVLQMNILHYHSFFIYIWNVRKKTFQDWAFIRGGGGEYKWWGVGWGLKGSSQSVCIMRGQRGWTRLCECECTGEEGVGTEDTAHSDLWLS